VRAVGHQNLDRCPELEVSATEGSEPRSEVLEIPRTKRRRPTLNAFSAIEVLVPYSSKAFASDIGRGRWTPHVSTWGALGELVAIGVKATDHLDATRSVTTRHKAGDMSRRELQERRA